MNARTRIKVDRDALVAKIKANSAASQAVYDVELAAFTVAESDYRSTVVDFLIVTAAKVRSGELTASELFSYGWRGGYLSEAPEAPTKPKAPADVSLAVAQLEMSTDASITITSEDFARYMA